MELSTLSMEQYSLVYNMLSFCIASMVFSGLFFIIAKDRVAPQYRMSVILSTMVVGIAGYHYFRIFGSWEAAFVLEGGAYVASGTPFNDAYRYMDWLLTVPLLVVELLLLCSVAAEKKEDLIFKTVVATVLMLIFGYLGETSGGTSLTDSRGVFGFLSTVPFVYIVWVLWNEVTVAMADKEGHLKILYRNIRLLLIFTWGYYPIVYMAPFIMDASSALVNVQVGYTIADVAAKAGYGCLIYAIARAKSDEEGFAVA
ncbi:MAG: bacteriorhodopsin [Bacteroidota bacterium]|nr:bacteriorhodopsin [Bacteroidota bacterium]